MINVRTSTFTIYTLLLLFCHFNHNVNTHTYDMTQAHMHNFYFYFNQIDLVISRIYCRFDVTEEKCVPAPKCVHCTKNPKLIIIIHYMGQRLSFQINLNLCFFLDTFVQLFLNNNTKKFYYHSYLLSFIFFGFFFWLKINKETLFSLLF